jgi:hypothetical protein
MFWVLIYISTNFLAPIPLISLRIDDFLSKFPPKTKNFACRISRKSPNRLKPDLRPAKAGKPAKAGPSPAKAGLPAGQRFHRTSIDPARPALFLASPDRQRHLPSSTLLAHAQQRARVPHLAPARCTPLARLHYSSYAA